MYDAKNDDFRIRGFIIDRIAPVIDGPHARRHVIAAHAQMGVGPQRLEAGLERVDESIGAGFGIGSDKGPDLCKV